MKVLYYERHVVLESENTAEKVYLEKVLKDMEYENPKFSRELRVENQKRSLIIGFENNEHE